MITSAETHTRTWELCLRQWSLIRPLLLPISGVLGELESSSNADRLLRNLLSSVSENTLTRYLANIHKFIMVSEELALDLGSLKQFNIADILLSLHRGEVHISNALKALRWAAKAFHLRLPDLYGGLLLGVESRVLSDRKEALPLPIFILAAWERFLLSEEGETGFRLFIGGLLVAANASLRFSDCQHVLWSSLQAGRDCLRAISYRTKSSRRGMPFGLVSCGFYGDPAAYYHSWVCKYLYLLGCEWDLITERFGETVPDALFFLSDDTEWRPMSYAQALSAFRGAPPHEAGNYTLHSLKTSLLASLAQLQVSFKKRGLQGHHRSSANGCVLLYSRDDVHGALSLQQMFWDKVRSGWLPLTPQARGGLHPAKQLPIEPPVLPFQTSPAHSRFPVEDISALPSATQVVSSPPAVPAPEAVEPAGDSDVDSSSSSMSSSAPSTQQARSWTKVSEQEAEEASTLDADLISLAKECRVPQEYHEILLGFDVPLFGCLVSEASQLDTALSQLLENSEEPDSAAGKLRLLSSLRLLFESCKKQSSAAPANKRPDSSEEARSSAAGWTEQFPPKLSGEKVISLQKAFHSRYPGEVLDPENFPSSRLLAYAAKIVQKGELKWVPWKIRMCQSQQDSMALRRPTKTPKLEDLLYDEVPQREIPSGQVGANYLSGIMGLLSTSLAMLNGAHLSVLRKFERKFIRLATQKMEAGLRNPSGEEIMMADRQLWGQMSDLVNLHNWSLDDALTEYTEVRGDMASCYSPGWLLLGARILLLPIFVPEGDKGKTRFLCRDFSSQKGCRPDEVNLCSSSVAEQFDWAGRSQASYFNAGARAGAQSGLCNFTFQHELLVKYVNLFLRGPLGDRSLHFGYLAAGTSVMSLDILRSATHDLTKDSIFELLLRLAFSGPGPKPLRTPAHMEGVPGLSSSDKARLDISSQLMSRAVELAHATFKAGGHYTFENPANSMIWDEPAVRLLLQKSSADVIIVSACAYGWDIYKRWAFASTFRDMQQLAADCRHPAGSHAQVAGVMDSSGGFISQQTSEFPELLAAKYVSSALPLFRKSDHPVDVSLEQLLQLLPTKGQFDPPFAHQDGAGIFSVPDWSFPPSGAVDKLGQVRQALMSKLFAMKAPLRLREHVASKAEQPLFSDQEVSEFRAVFQEFLEASSGKRVDWSVKPHQPYALQALHQLSEVLEDPDTSLFPTLLEGAPSGYFQDIPPSRVFIPLGSDSAPSTDQLVIHNSNWK
ncbi:unnamed protein product, partial [Symbiodinium microadriaticum]